MNVDDFSGQLARVQYFRCQHNPAVPSGTCSLVPQQAGIDPGCFLMCAACTKRVAMFLADEIVTEAGAAS